MTHLLFHKTPNLVSSEPGAAHTNIIVEPDNVEFGKALSSLEAPYSVFSPGLAGVSRTENYVSDGVLLRALARGDANVVLRNILYRLREKPEWDNFESDLALVFPAVKLDVRFEPKIDQFIDVKTTEAGQTVPLDLSGTGLLQAVQILAYLQRQNLLYSMNLTLTSTQITKGYYVRS